MDEYIRKDTARRIIDSPRNREQMVAMLEAVPSEDVQPVRHGHWINHPDDLFPEDSMIECSVCHEYEYATANDNFCGNCGAKMDEVKNDG